jgi:hypothetical protein
VDEQGLERTGRFMERVGKRKACGADAAVGRPPSGADFEDGGLGGGLQSGVGDAAFGEGSGAMRRFFSSRLDLSAALNDAIPRVPRRTIAFEKQ